MADVDTRVLFDRRKLLAWVHALESGQYEQGQARLHGQYNQSGEESFCCLGVLCRVAIADGLDLAVVTEDRSGDQTVYGFGAEKEFAYLPKEVSAWLLAEGVQADPDDGDRSFAHNLLRNPPVGDHPHEGRPLQATEANDAMRFSFPRIAEYLRKYYQLNELEAGK